VSHGYCQCKAGTWASCGL